MRERAALCLKPAVRTTGSGQASLFQGCNHDAHGSDPKHGWSRPILNSHSPIVLRLSLKVTEVSTKTGEGGPH